MMMKMMAGMMGLLLGFSSSHALGPNRVAAQIPRVDDQFTCRFAGHLDGGSVALIVGGEVLSGRGYLNCRNSQTGHVKRMPVAFRMVGGGLGIDFNFLDDVHLISADVTTNDPAALLRTFRLHGSNGSALTRAGLDFDQALGASKGDGQQFEIALSGDDVRRSNDRFYATTLIVQRF